MNVVPPYWNSVFLSLFQHVCGSDAVSLIAAVAQRTCVIACGRASLKVILQVPIPILQASGLDMGGQAVKWG